MKRDAVTLTDHRTGKSYDIDLADGAIPAIQLRQVKVSEDDFGLMTYDPAFQNTAACKSRITFIDGDKGILRYRGYPIEDLAEYSNFLEVSYLLVEEELPSKAQLEEWKREITSHTEVPEAIGKLCAAFPRDAHPMGILVSLLAALATAYPDARTVTCANSRRLQIMRLLGKVPVIGAYALRQITGQPIVEPDKNLSYTGNFLKMAFATGGAGHGRETFTPNPVLERALDTLFVLHADHEQNCSTSAMRNIGSSQADPFASMAGAAAALWGPLHGGANEAVLRMLGEIGSKDRIPEFIERVKAGETRLMGFGHRVYKNYDPRAKIIKQLADEVFDIQGVNPLLEIALELERIALSDDYFVTRKLYPNVDFYSGLIYQSMGFPVDFFPVLFAIGRAPGWLAQWNELMGDGEQKIARPRQLYLGEGVRGYDARG